ncbi:MAG: hypothetical protein L0G99_16650, partial [Propionibacteriales bacterium]|nr:hypothetical protein [Propionibacteriales bacterium]
GLANALDTTLAALIAEPPPIDPPNIVRSGEGNHVKGQAVEAWLLETITGRGAITEIYDFRLHTSTLQRSAAHPTGTREHLRLHAGRMRIGPVSHAAEIAAGDFITFDASTEHLYQRLGRAVPQGLLVISRTS